MTFAIRLRRRHFKRSYYAVLTPEWISNAHWAVKRARVSNAGMFLDDASVADWLSCCELKNKTEDDIQKFFSDVMKPFWVTPLVIGRHSPARVLIADGDYSLIDDRYAQMFDVEVGQILYAADGQRPMCHARTKGDSDFVIMPQRHLEPDVSAGVTALAKSLDTESRNGQVGATELTV